MRAHDARRPARATVRRPGTCSDSPVPDDAVSQEIPLSGTAFPDV
jgi:hypothetical protein